MMVVSVYRTIMPEPFSGLAVVMIGLVLLVVVIKLTGQYHRNMMIAPISCLHKGPLTFFCQCLR